MSAFTFTVVPLSQAAGLEDFFGAAEEPTIYPTPRFLKFLQQLLSCEIAVGLAKDAAGKIRGVLPLAIMQSADGRRIANSLPFFGSYGSPIVAQGLDENDRRALKKALIEHCSEHLRTLNCMAWTVIVSPFDADMEWYAANVAHDFLDHRIGQINRLPPPSSDIPAALFEIFHESRVRNIKKAMQSGLTVSEHSTPEGMQELLALHRDNMGAIGGLCKPARFFELLPQALQAGRDWRLYAAHHNGTAVAFLLLLFFGGIVEYYIPAVREDFRTVQPTTLIVLNSMTAAVENRERLWNWGGTWVTQEGVYQFKKKWGCEERNYPYLTRIYDKTLLEMSPETARATFPFFYSFPY